MAAVGLWSSGVVRSGGYLVSVRASSGSKFDVVHSMRLPIAAASRISNLRNMETRRPDPCNVNLGFPGHCRRHYLH